MIYHRLSFEDDLFTSRAYKRNYRYERSQRPRGKESEAHVILTTTVVDVDYQCVSETTLGKDGLHGRKVFNSDPYANLVDACGRGDNDSVRRQLTLTPSSPNLLRSITSGLLHFCPIYATVSKGHVEVMQTLLQFAEEGNFLRQVVEKPIGGIEDDHCRPLHVATMKGNLPMVKLLLENGASTHVQTGLGLQAIHLAARVASMEILTTLISAGADTNCTDVHGLKPQDFASEPCIKEYLRQREESTDALYLSDVSTPSSPDEDPLDQSL